MLCALCTLSASTQNHTFTVSTHPDAAWCTEIVYSECIQASFIYHFSFNHASTIICRVKNVCDAFTQVGQPLTHSINRIDEWDGKMHGITSSSSEWSKSLNILRLRRVSATVCVYNEKWCFNKFINNAAINHQRTFATRNVKSKVMHVAVANRRIRKWNKIRAKQCRSRILCDDDDNEEETPIKCVFECGPH